MPNTACPDPDVVEALVRENQGLLHRALRLMVGDRRIPGVGKDDLLQEAQFGLLKAARTFDPSRGVKFCTHAFWWIRGAISHAILTNSRHWVEHADLEHADHTRPGHAPRNRQTWPDARAEAEDECERLRAEILRLPERERMAVEMRMGGCKLNEIAQALGVTRGGARCIHIRALNRLRSQLADGGCSGRVK